MQTNDLKNILDRISPFFIVKRIHKNGDDWTIIGRLLSDATEQDLKVSMKGSEFALEVKQTVENLDLLFNIAILAGSAGLLCKTTFSRFAVRNRPFHESAVNNWTK